MTNVICVSGRACESLCAPSLRIALELANDITHRERVAQEARRRLHMQTRGRARSRRSLASLSLRPESVSEEAQLPGDP